MGKVRTKRRTQLLKWNMARSSITPGSRVFDEIERPDSSPKRREENLFHFYNRSGRSVIGTVRQFIEECFQRYPKEEREELRTRIRSCNDEQFKSATFELFIHEALNRQGCELTPHPTLGSRSSKKPDFLVTTKAGEKFYLEAAIVTEVGGGQKGAEAIKARVLDELDRSPHQNFILFISESGSPLNQPSGKQIVIDIHRWLDSLDVEVVANSLAADGHSALPEYCVQCQGWSLKVQAWPLDEHSRGNSKALIGSGVKPSFHSDIQKRIRKKVKDKSSRYGDLKLPLVIALNVENFAMDHIDEEQALYGDEQFVFRLALDQPLIRRRNPNGAWHSNQGAQGRKGSAVWIINNLQASSLATTDNVVYLNPWAHLDAPSFFEQFPNVRHTGREIIRSNGASLSSLLGLHSSWPREEAV